MSLKLRKLNWPLMRDAITIEDRNALCLFLAKDKRLTNGDEVKTFEKAWSKWLGVKYSVMVNSGASANLLTMAYLKSIYPEGGEVIVPTLTWVSDIASVLQNGFKPVFVDIDPYTLGLDWEKVHSNITKKTKAVFLTHTLGFNAMTNEGWLRIFCKHKNLLLIEDCCEAHGANWEGSLVGSIGDISNFSFYYGHHMTTIEGGMISTNDEASFETFRMLRSHGMNRERSKSKDKGFTFQLPGYNVRPTELNAVLGNSQLERLDDNILKRTENLKTFLSHLDQNKFRTHFNVEESSSYALPIILEEKNKKLAAKVEATLTSGNIEFRKGFTGGNQLRHPYLKHLKIDPKKFPNTEHIHFFGWYVGNYPALKEEHILQLTERLNNL